MEENGLGPKSNYIPEVNAGANGSKKKKKDVSVEIVQDKISIFNEIDSLIIIWIFFLN